MMFYSHYVFQSSRGMQTEANVDLKENRVPGALQMLSLTAVRAITSKSCNLITCHGRLLNLPTQWKEAVPASS
jgi:hypothetical protein